MKFVRKIRAAFQYEKAARLFNEGQYAKALTILGIMDGDQDTMAKSVLFSANIKNRMGDLVGAEDLYLKFRDHGIQGLSRVADQAYLRIYCDYFLIQTRRKMGRSDVIGTTHEDLISAAKQATYLTRKEFPPQ